MKKQIILAAVSLILGAALCFSMAFRTAAAESYYVENEWNYADGSIDTMHGIPDNATGVMDRIGVKACSGWRRSRISPRSSLSIRIRSASGSTSART